MRIDVIGPIEVELYQHHPLYSSTISTFYALEYNSFRNGMEEHNRVLVLKTHMPEVATKLLSMNNIELNTAYLTDKSLFEHAMNYLIEASKNLAYTITKSPFEGHFED